MQVLQSQSKERGELLSEMELSLTLGHHLFASNWEKWRSQANIKEHKLSEEQARVPWCSCIWIPLWHYLPEWSKNLSMFCSSWVCYKSLGTHSHCSGWAVLLKNHLKRDFLKINCSQDCISLKLTYLLSGIFVACCVLVSDSRYFSLDMIGEIQGLIRSHPQEKIVNIGDLNAKFGASWQQLLLESSFSEFSYHGASDLHVAPN